MSKPYSQLQYELISNFSQTLVVVVVFFVVVVVEVVFGWVVVVVLKVVVVVVVGVVLIVVLVVGPRLVGAGGQGQESKGGLVGPLTHPLQMSELPHLYSK